tara:strand:+ start:456 stop:608 length:153 start_codon:yes stop_codon:yes gene_type:complete
MKYKKAILALEEEMEANLTLYRFGNDEAALKRYQLMSEQARHLRNTQKNK